MGQHLSLRFSDLFVSATLWGWHAQSAIFKWAQTNSRGEDHKKWRPHTSVSSGFPVRQLDGGHFISLIKPINYGEARLWIRISVFKEEIFSLIRRPSSLSGQLRKKSFSDVEWKEIRCYVCKIHRFSPWLSGSTIKITKGRLQVALTSNLL